MKSFVESPFWEFLPGIFPGSAHTAEVFTQTELLSKNKK